MNHKFSLNSKYCTTVALGCVVCWFHFCCQSTNWKSNEAAHQLFDQFWCKSATQACIKLSSLL